MRIRFINAMLVTNPAWSEADMHAAQDRREKYAVPALIDVDPGYEIADPLAWIHCCPGDLNSAPIAQPVDDECREAVRVWMEEKRPAAIAAIKAQLEQIDMLTNREDRKRLLAMGEAYGLTGKSRVKSQESKADATA